MCTKSGSGLWKNLGASSLSKSNNNDPWKLVDEYFTVNKGKISIYNRDDDPMAEIITLVTANRRIVVHRTKKEAILMSSDRQGNATRYLQCKRE